MGYRETGIPTATVQLYDARQHTVKAICKMLGISKPTLYKYIDAARSQTS